MRQIIAAGYAFTAMLYLAAWWNPTGETRQGLLAWVSFTKLCLTEFLSLHAATLLGALVLANVLGDTDQEMGPIFWVMLAFYALLAIGAFLFHRSHRALIGFYMLIVLRAAEFFSVGAPEPDVMRATVVKNFMMSVPMMLLIAGISMNDDGLTPWQESFARSHTIGQRIWRGRAMLFVVGYYLLWAIVELTFPERLKQ